MKKGLKYIVKTLLLLCALIVFYFIYYCAIYGLYYIELSDAYPSRDLVVEVTRSSMSAAGNVLIALMYPLVLLIWSQRKSILYRLSYFLIFSIICIIVMYYLSSSLITIVLLPISAILYKKLLTKE